MTPRESLYAIIVPEVAFMSDDCLEILRFAADSRDQGVGVALVTLVEIRGGAARAIGSQMAVRSDGLHCGYVSGGCTEAAVAAEAMKAIANGVDRYLLIGEGSRFFDIVLPCGGAITPSIHVLRNSQALRTVIDSLDARRRCGLRYNPDAQRLEASSFAAETGWSDGSFSIAYRPKNARAAERRIHRTANDRKPGESCGVRSPSLDQCGRRTEDHRRTD